MWQQRSGPPPPYEALTPQSVGLRQPRGALVFVKCASDTMGKCSVVLLNLLGVKNGKNSEHEVNWCGKQYSAAEIMLACSRGDRAAAVVSPAASIEDTTLCRFFFLKGLGALSQRNVKRASWLRHLCPLMTV